MFVRGVWTETKSKGRWGGFHLPTAASVCAPATADGAQPSPGAISQCPRTAAQRMVSSRSPEPSVSRAMELPDTQALRPVPDLPGPKRRVLTSLFWVRHPSAYLLEIGACLVPCLPMPIHPLPRSHTWFSVHHQYRLKPILPEGSWRASLNSPANHRPRGNFSHNAVALRS